MAEVLFYLGVVTGIIGLFAAYRGSRPIIRYGIAVLSLLMIFAGVVIEHLGH